MIIKFCIYSSFFNEFVKLAASAVLSEYYSIINDTVGVSVSPALIVTQEHTG